MRISSHAHMIENLIMSLIRALGVRYNKEAWKQVVRQSAPCTAKARS